MPEIIDSNVMESYRNELSRASIKCINNGSLGQFRSSSSSIANSDVVVNQTRGISVSHGDINKLHPHMRKFVDQCIELCQPDSLHICDGSEEENKKLLDLLHKGGTLMPLTKYENSWLALTNPVDTARVESKTYIVTDKKEEAIPTPREGVKGKLGFWMSPAEMDKLVKERMKNCMKGRIMYLIPFSMGPIASPLAKIGIQLTDSAYVVVCSRTMTRMGQAVLDKLGTSEDYVQCLHSAGAPADGKIEYPTWPCDPERTMILHVPKENKIISYGSGYGGNSLLGKKCFALRIGSTIARREGWLAEHMLILGITNPQGKKRYITAAFPSACGKTNMAMMTPTIPGYKIECVGDDIAWMRFDKNGVLHAINPENGFFGVAPGTSCKSNPMAMETIQKNTYFTNTARTCDGAYYWEGLEEESDPNAEIIDWHNKPWKRGSKTPAAHANSRFCTPAKQCPIISPDWEKPEGVPISAIIFGGRRPTGVPLVFEARDWKHGVLIGASVRSEATAAAEHKGKQVMNDPFAMRPFFGYNFGHYMCHWLSMEQKSKTLPKIYHVNWFRKDKDGKFLWPGYGENSRVLDWILRRLDGEDVIQDSPIGGIPKPGSINLKGLNNVDEKQLFDIPKDFWQQEVKDIEQYLLDQVGDDIPCEIINQLEIMKKKFNEMK